MPWAQRREACFTWETDLGLNPDSATSHVVTLGGTRRLSFLLWYVVGIVSARPVRCGEEMGEELQGSRACARVAVNRGAASVGSRARLSLGKQDPPAFGKKEVARAKFSPATG